MSHDTTTPARVRWARLRFAIIGPLLSAPAETGDLAPRIEDLAARAWRHPSTGDSIRFSAKSIERWYYAARNEQDPIRALERKVPKHAGTHPRVTAEVADAIRTLRKQHPRWSYRLVHDNLVAVGRERPELGVLPGYATVTRFMKHHGLGKHRRPRRHEQEPGFVPRERRFRSSSRPRRPSSHERKLGARIQPFGACSGFTRVAARTFADPPKAGLCPQCFDRSVTLPASWVATKMYRHLLGPDFHRLR